MENPTFSPEMGDINKKFNNPQEELEFLREKVAKQEQESNNIEQAPREENISKQIHEYKKEKPEVVLEESYKLPEKQEDEIVLKLSPEEHDSKMAELLGILQEKGIKNTLSIVNKMGDIHIADDFHRFLVQYIKEGFNTPDLKERSPLWRYPHSFSSAFGLSNTCKEN